nr:FUSC family protein [Noviherbaspirillum sp. L7-7A]
MPSRAELLFSAKSFAAAMLALYLAMSISLPRPFWAMLTAYVVSNPLSGAVRSKALYRVSGTILGSMATVLLVPRLSNAPELLALALALWVGVCLYISLHDRTPRSYVFMLAGYTAALIGFPAVGAPDTVFDVALARVEEITLGIVCATLIHSVVLPQSMAPALLARLDRALDDARRWLRDGLGAGSNAGERRSLAGDITELRVMATHLPFDTSNLRWTGNTINALQDRLALMMPLLAGIEDRLQALRKANADADAASRWQALLQRIVVWNEAGASANGGMAGQLHVEIDTLRPGLTAASNWADLLQVNLACRLHALLRLCTESADLRAALDDSLHGRQPARPRVAGSRPWVLHRDPGMALLSAAAAVIAILACCAFWILTAWPAGSAAAMMAAVFCCFFATQDDPVPGIRLFFNYTLASIPISAVYLLLVMPAVHSFEMLMLAVAPCFLLLGIYVARPATTGAAMAMLFGVAGMLSMQDTGTLDLVSFINSMLAQLAGIAAAAVFTRLLRSVSVDWTARRLLRAGWRELASLAGERRVPSVEAVSVRMVDRIGMLTPRLAMAAARGQENGASLDALHAFGDLRIGLNVAQLRRLAPQLQLQQPALARLLQDLASHFRTGHVLQQRADTGLLRQLDAALAGVCAESASAHAARIDAAAALVGIRRGLFPDAATYPAGAPAQINRTTEAKQ